MSRYGSGIGQVRNNCLDNTQLPGAAPFTSHDQSRHHVYEQLSLSCASKSHDGTKFTNLTEATALYGRISGQYSPEVCQSPTSWDRPPAHSDSEDSMDNHVRNQTPPEMPPRRNSPTDSTTQHIGQLDLGQQSLAHHDRPVDCRDPRNSARTPPAGSKRAASREFPARPPRLSPGAQGQKPRQSYSAALGRLYGHDRRNNHRMPEGTPQARLTGPQKSAGAGFGALSSRIEHVKQEHPALPRDIGYWSRKNTCSTLPPNVPQHYESGDRPQQISLPYQDADSKKPRLPFSLKYPTEEPRHELVQRPRPAQGNPQTRQPRRYANMISQPESSPISQDQLAAEIKDIYAELVVVEAKCISTDAAQAADPSSEPSPEQWEELIALHRTLLYEHHDFLMATQHPSANQALARLAVKYSMPARMWKHGIHAFLEVLRHRRPASQEYMLSFIYLAYSMIALLYETVPTFVDTWVECLGDLARYRMAIEEDRETRALWGGVAARWYTMAADRHPSIGRLCHHLGILERPSMLKFCFYAKALTSVVPFANTKESLATLCGPIVNDDKLAETRKQSAEACAITYHALLSFDRIEEASNAASKTLTMLRRLPANKWKDLGISLAITNVASILNLGAQNNTPRLAFVRDVQGLVKNDPHPHQHGAAPTLPPPPSFFETVLTTDHVPPSEITIRFTNDSFALALQRRDNQDSLHGVLPFVHVNVIWLRSLSSLRSRHANDNDTYHMFDSLMANAPWVDLTHFLNQLTRCRGLPDRLVACAQQKRFLQPDRRGNGTPFLQDDFAIRGLVWAYDYFPPDWFEGLEDDDGSRAIETSAMHEVRKERVIYLGLWLAFHTEFLSYERRRFFAKGSRPGDADPVLKAMAADSPPKSSSSGTVSGASDVGGDFKAVKGAKARRQVPQKTSYANVVSGKRTGKRREYFNTGAAFGGVDIVKRGE